MANDPGSTESCPSNGRDTWGAGVTTGSLCARLVRGVPTMTNKNAVTRKRHPGFGVLLGGLDRISSAGGKAILDQRLIQPNGPLQVQHATFLESTIGGLLLLLRIYLPIP